MIRRLTDMMNGEQRRNALGKTKRLEDFRYNDNSMDAPTPEDTEREQRQTQYLLSKGLLDGLDKIESYEQKIAWLKRTGLCGVYDNSLNKIVRFDEEKPDPDYVDRAFRKEIQSQMGLLGEVADINNALNN